MPMMAMSPPARVVAIGASGAAMGVTGAAAAGGTLRVSSSKRIQNERFIEGGFSSHLGIAIAWVLREAGDVNVGSYLATK